MKSKRESIPNLIHRTIAPLCVLLLLLCGTALRAQISPGDLAKVHSHLEGMSNCTKCHILGEKVSNDKCLACHTELKSRIDQQKGYHSSAAIKGKQCASCHNDHHGVNFQIIRFEPEKFNHTLTGYTLSGAHSRKKCADCHKPGNIQDAKIKAKKFTYLGLGTACLNCHADYHQKTLASDCAGCHDAEHFKPASKFSHQRAAFQLTGKHTEVLCADCHAVTTRGGQKFQEFKGVKTNCASCHKDIHAGKFGTNCVECHNTASFTSVGGVSNFDHSKADFKLEGRHTTVQCKQCHKDKLTTPLKFSRCTDCHKDYHNGDFLKNGVAQDCGTCHSVKGFTEFSFTVEQHNAAAFALKGAHLATPCIVCHKKEEKWKFRGLGLKCADCHQNIHQNVISDKYYPASDCESCHSQSRWNTVTFDHSRTQFGLEGAHTRQNCRSCHFNKEKTGHATQKFAGLATACTTCHTDVHFSQFDENGVTNCLRCHSSEAFKPVTKFNHSTTQFPLDGRHINVACVKCHKPESSQGETFVRYKIKDFKCADCHR
jgi:nitrate/TMAO reductase-like tetraheme cytochrome c subunit